MATTLKLISKEELIDKFKEIEAKGWIKCPVFIYLNKNSSFRDEDI